jgi:eukaryotic-like serine/threonine-protein kinase
MEIELQPGTSLGNYELLVRVGRGGMASVWVARDRPRDGGKERLIAVKAMLPELANDSEFRAMFLEEGQIVRSIEHANVVRVHGVGEDRGILYLAMEWVEGDSLRTIIRDAKKRRAIPIELAVRIIADAAAGLHAAHELRGWDGELRNIVHCDISPHNILVGIDGVAKLVDFGVANATIHSDFGGSDKVKGKLGYMSPEQVRAEPLDRRSDVFALGIVLFELTTGERLFQGETAAHTLTLVQTARVPDLEKLHPGYPPKLAAIVYRALQHDKQLRFQTALELREALERYLVEDRIMVSQAGVGALVRRVLGGRIEALRQELSEALVARDGVLNAALIPQSPAGAGSFSGVVPNLLSEPPGGDSSVHGRSGTPRPETYDTPAPARTGMLPWLSAFTGIVAAAGSVLWVTRPVDIDDTDPLPAVAASNPAAPRTLARAEPRASDSASNGSAQPDAAAGIDVGSLPLDRPTAVDRDPPRAAAPAAAAVRNPVKPSPEKVVLAEEPEVPEVVLEEDVANPYRSGGAATPEANAAPGATDTKPTDAKPADRATQGPFNRGVALAQLSASASRAAACRRPGGPSGSGRATVTFTNDGSPKSVAVSAPFAGTPVGACVSAAFRSIHVPPFTGSPVTLPWSFRIAE